MLFLNIYHNVTLNKYRTLVYADLYKIKTTSNLP